MAGLRREVLKKYRDVLRLSRTWQASEGSETAAERQYIREEAGRLFRKNQHVSWTILCVEEVQVVALLESASLK